jgi:HSP20 family protein
VSTVSQQNPFERIERLVERMSQQFDDLAEEFDGEPAGTAALDLVDEGEAYVATADVPGFEREDVDITLQGRRLELSAERDAETEAHDGEYLRRERRHRSVSRSVQLPGEVEAGGATAEMHHGVLTVTLPKAGTDEGRTISIG